MAHDIRDADHSEFTLSGVEALEMTDMLLFVSYP